MTAITILLCFVLLIAASGLALWRILSGPDVLDRVIGFDLVAICIGGMIILLSIWWGTHLFIEIMLIFSLLGFVGTVAYVCYLLTHPARLRPQKKEKPSHEKESS